MKKSDGYKRPYVRPVNRIELSEKNIKPRLIVLVLFLAIAAVALVTGVREFLKVEPGWQEIQIASRNPNCGSEFVLMYDFSDYGGAASVANEELKQIYTQASEMAFKIFTPDVEDSSVQNLWYLNHHVNEPVTVDPVLYEALVLLEDSGNRNLYLAPAYVEYNRIFLCENQEEAALYDPAFHPELIPYLQQLAGFASNPEAIHLEPLGNNRIRLNISQEYLDFAKEYDVETFLDFAWMKNAFIADYLAQVLTENGYTSGYLASFDGFTRNLDTRGNSYSLNLFNRQGQNIYLPAVMHYAAPMSFVSLRDFPLSEQDRWHYYAYSDGTITSVYLDPADALVGTTADALMLYGRETGCAELLMDAIPVFIGNEFRTETLEGLAEGKTFAIWFEGNTIRTTDPAASLELLEETYSLQ